MAPSVASPVRDIKQSGRDCPVGATHARFDTTSGLGIEIGSVIPQESLVSGSDDRHERTVNKVDRRPFDVRSEREEERTLVTKNKERDRELSLFSLRKREAVWCVIHRKKGHASCVSPERERSKPLSEHVVAVPRGARNPKLPVDPGCITVEERSSTV